MSKYLRVTMSDGSQWDVPAQLIAEDRARYYAALDVKRGDATDFDKAFAEEVADALNDDDELLDWAPNNMNWSDVSDQAVLVGDRPDTNFQEDWCNGEKEVIDR